MSSHAIVQCQVCRSKALESVVFLGHLPPVNDLKPLGSKAEAEMRFPLELLRCTDCGLLQIGYAVDQTILFPASYPYRSGTTRILRDNFKELYQRVMQVRPLAKTDLAVDVGSNDGTLLAPFRDGGHKVFGVEPSDAAQDAIKAGIPSHQGYFSLETAKAMRAQQGPAAVLTMTNVFAHIDDVQDIVAGVAHWLADDGIFICENHDSLSVVSGLQYDTIYHEHLRYYHTGPLKRLLGEFGFEIFAVEQIPTHGGSFRSFCARKGKFPIQPSVAEREAKEKAAGLTDGAGLKDFARRVGESKVGLLKLLAGIRERGLKVYGVGAPSRASTLISYCGIDRELLDCTLEVPQSPKCGQWLPGTRVPVQPEDLLVKEPPAYLLLLSWHIADELMPKLRAKGFKGGFIIPLPVPRIVEAA